MSCCFLLAEAQARRRSINDFDGLGCLHPERDRAQSNGRRYGERENRNPHLLALLSARAALRRNEPLQGA
jgi:hypothetical protein